MIIGIGTDIVAINRIQGIQERLGDRFAHRILTKDEFNVYVQRKRSVSYLAMRFAAKEAASKALGTGIGKVSFHDIETLHTEAGAPIIQLHGHAATLKEQKKIRQAHISLSDEEAYVIAFVVLEG